MKTMTRKTKIILATILFGSLLAIAPQFISSFSVFAEKNTPKNVQKSKTGDSPENKDKQCSQVQNGGDSVHYGKCGNVCKGKEVKKDSGGAIGPAGGLYNSDLLEQLLLTTYLRQTHNKMFLL